MSKKLKAQIAARELVFGTHISLAEPAVSEIYACAGLDFIWIDTEHAAIDYAPLQNHIGMLRLAGVPVIVRVGIDTPWHVKRILEMGADGIVFPMINTQEEAEKAMRCCLYPPEGERGFGPRRAVRYGFDNVSGYIAQSNQELCKFVQIETVTALSSLPVLLDNAYIDGFIFGPCDLSFSLGHPNQTHHETVVAAIKKAIGQIQSSGKSIGISTGEDSLEEIRYWRELGINFISAGADTSYLCRGVQNYRENINQLRNQLSQKK
ncbi:MAG: aldolase/citrate lyase family protein [Victivallaceae bacterium]|nr:aldolase/citrate lyase family protein [Victivallaceae bacterium]